MRGYDRAERRHAVERPRIDCRISLVEAEAEQVELLRGLAFDSTRPCQAGLALLLEPAVSLVRGIVRWCDGISAGIEFLCPLSVEQLASRSPV